MVDSARQERLFMEELMDKKWWTLIAVGTGTFMLLLDVTIVTVAQQESKAACTRASRTLS